MSLSWNDIWHVIVKNTKKQKEIQQWNENREGRWKWVENYKPRRNNTNGVWDNRRISFLFSERESGEPKRKLMSSNQFETNC